MASGITLYGPNGKALPKRWRGGALNNMVQSARQNDQRKALQPLDYDVHRNVSALGRRTMMTFGRHIYANFDVIRGMVNEVAELSGSTFLPDFRVEDRGWKDETEELLDLHGEICDVAGPPYNLRMYRRLLVSSLLIDGQMGTVNVRGENGYPFLQIIPGHRIGSSDGETTVEGGPWDGARIIDGVIVNDYGAPLAYRVNLSDSGRSGFLAGASADKDYIDISARDMKLHFVPVFPGQVTGFSLLGFCAFSCQDVKEWDDFERMAQKIASVRTFVEATEDGEPPIGADHVGLPDSDTDTTNTPTGLVTELLDGGLTTYVRAKSGAGLEAVKFDRPSQNQRDFREETIRGSMHALNWSYDFSVKPGQVNGAPMRVVVDKINRMIAQTQELGLVPAMRRFDRFRVARFMDMKRLRFVPDWYKVEYQGPGKLTADKKYDSDVASQEIRMGTQSRSKRAMENGETLGDVRRAKWGEVDELFAEASRLSKKHGISFDLALNRLESDQMTSYPVPAEGLKPGGANGGDGKE